MGFWFITKTAIVKKEAGYKFSNLEKFKKLIAKSRVDMKSRVDKRENNGHQTDTK